MINKRESTFASLTFSELEPELRVVALGDHERGKVSCVVELLVNKAHVEALREHSKHSCAMKLGKVFAEADTGASAERQESLRVAFLARASL